MHSSHEVFIFPQTPMLVPAAVIVRLLDEAAQEPQPREKQERQHTAVLRQVTTPSAPSHPQAVKPTFRYD